MKYLFHGKSNYDKFPFIKINGCENDIFEGWDALFFQLKEKCSTLNKKKIVIVAECYTGINDSVEEIFAKNFESDYFIKVSEAMKSTQEIDKMVFPDITDDEIFGFMTRLQIIDFFDADKLKLMKEKVEHISSGVVLLYGTGASLLATADVLIYLDMPRWEAQLRFRRNEISNLGAGNKYERASLQYKRAYFVDWRVCDKLKRKLMSQWDFVIDTIDVNIPKIITGKAYREGLTKVVNQPFRVVPFFDPGPWGGQWMKEICDLEKDADNFAWCFDCVPEENSLLLQYGDILFETPAINLVFYLPEKLLGRAVYGRFGDEFPIRFDFLDTMEGGNLSLQVHPLTEYIQEHFGVRYTQDESYYLLDAAEDACVYLGLKAKIKPEDMLRDLKKSQKTGEFDAEKYVEKWKAKKHDHFLIPAGTVHCSGANSMVLEISATPYIFTFKLWDWNRMGLDGRPRPINIEHGEKVIQWNRTTEWTEKNLVNQISTIAEGNGWKEERTGLHELEFIETRRHWFSKKVTHINPYGVNVLNLVEGSEVIVESENGEFDPFVVHYAETFIIPATAKNYSIRPYGLSEGMLCGTIKAYVRNQA